MIKNILCMGIIISTIAISIVPEAVFARPSKKLGYAVVPRNQVSQLWCYMRTRDSKILDLRPMCGGVIQKTTFLPPNSFAIDNRIPKQKKF
jgi:hypothetical protein